MLLRCFGQRDHRVSNAVCWLRSFVLDVNVLNDRSDWRGWFSLGSHVKLLTYIRMKRKETEVSYLVGTGLRSFLDAGRDSLDHFLCGLGSSLVFGQLGFLDHSQDTLGLGLHSGSNLLLDSSLHTFVGQCGLDLFCVHDELLSS